MSKILLPPHKEIKVEGEVALSENGGQGGIEDVGKGGPMDKPLLSLPVCPIFLSREERHSANCLEKPRPPCVGDSGSRPRSV